MGCQAFFFALKVVVYTLSYTEADAAYNGWCQIGSAYLHAIIV